MKTLSNFQEELKLTLRYNDKLNSKLWDNEKIKPEVRSNLLKIAKRWAVFSNIPGAAIKDIIVVGGNANYNYTKYSDIDLHLVVNKDKIADCPDLIDDYLRDKKQLWALSHDIKIYGHDVELYAQDEADALPKDQGVYSLTKNTWLVKPVKKEINVNDKTVIQKVKTFIDYINFLITNKADDRDALDKLKEKLRKMRAVAIEKGGEFAPENLVFKELRNRGYLEKISKQLKNIDDISLSLD